MVTSGFAVRPGAGSGAAAALGRALRGCSRRLDTWSSSTSPVKCPHSRLPASIADQPCLVIFAADVAAAIARVESLGASGDSERSERPASAARTPNGSGCRPSDRPSSTKPMRVRPSIACSFELGAAAEIGDQADMVELGPPAPFEVLVRPLPDRRDCRSGTARSEPGSAAARRASHNSPGRCGEAGTRRRATDG